MIPSTSHRSILRFVLVLAALAASGVAMWPDTGFAIPARFTNKVIGTATYRERIALTPGAVFEATLEEASRGDAPATVIARARVKRPGQVPIDFELRYDSRRVEPREQYVVRASIIERGRVLFTGSQSYRVRTRGQSRSVTVLMRRTPGDHGGPGGGGPRGDYQDQLTNTRWRLVRIGNRDVVLPERQREPWIELERRTGRVTGSGGCNRVSGSYESGRGTLQFGPLISTQMACPS
ncbi:MAG TPA: YbaY family lipoprotein, partial [Candidatus Limnocylindrales bacterium]|nr:YbaY family lipoprotein [Candidatus Limnocylindrales bacterium]